MFEKVIPKIEQFTRPLFTISRKFESDLITQESSTIFFVNEFGCALTTFDIASKFFPTHPYIEKYNAFKQSTILPDSDYEKLKSAFGFTANDSIIDLKTIFINCGNNISRVNTILSPQYNMALLHFDGVPEFTYSEYARFCDTSENFKKGKELMLLGFPFPGSSNYLYNQAADEIEWNMTTPFIIDSFPLKGLITRQLYNNSILAAIELSISGYKGHEGSPLFDEHGTIYGMHCINSNAMSGESKVENIPIFSQCISSTVITQFLQELGVKFYKIENGKEVVYNENGHKPVPPKQILPTVYISGDGESSVHVKEIRTEIGGQVIVDYKEPFQVAVGKTDEGSRKEGVALVQFATDGTDEIFISEENAGNVSHLNRNNYYKLNVLKKEVTSPNWKVKVSVKTQLSSQFYYFDILVIRRHKERDHKKDPHITFFPDASGKYIRYDNEKSIKISTKKIIKGNNSTILPLKSKIEANEFEIEINYTVENDVLSISDLVMIEK